MPTDSETEYEQIKSLLDKVTRLDGEITRVQMFESLFDPFGTSIVYQVPFPTDEKQAHLPRLFAEAMFGAIGVAAAEHVNYTTVAGQMDATGRISPAGAEVLYEGGRLPGGEELTLLLVDMQPFNTERNIGRLQAVINLSQLWERLAANPEQLATVAQEALAAGRFSRQDTQAIAPGAKMDLVSLVISVHMQVGVPVNISYASPEDTHMHFRTMELELGDPKQPNAKRLHVPAAAIASVVVKLLSQAAGIAPGDVSITRLGDVSLIDTEDNRKKIRGAIIGLQQSEMLAGLGNLDFLRGGAEGHEGQGRGTKGYLQRLDDDQGMAR